MDFERNLDRLEAYTNGRMDDTARHAFEQDMAQNPELADMADLYGESMAVIEQGIENSLRDQLQHWAAEEQQAQGQKPAAKVVRLRPRIMQWSVAASVALLVGAFALVQHSQHFSDDALYTAYYDAPGTLSGLRGNTKGTPLDLGLHALTKGDFDAAIQALATVPQTNNHFAQAQYHLGHAALQLGRHNEAIAAFAQAAASQDMKVSEKAAWYQALTYVAAHRTDDPAFRQLLDGMAQDENHSFQTDAQRLQGQLGDFRRRLAR